MATRFRLPASGAAAVSPALQSYSHSQTTRRPLPTSDATALASQAYTPDAADHLVAGDAHHVQFVSAPLLVQNLSAQTVKAVIQCFEAHTNNNLTLQFWVGLYSNDGSTLIATLLAKNADAVELATSLTSRSWSATTTGYNMVSGDLGARIVVEISVVGTPAGSGGVQGHNATLRFGSDGAGGDLLENDTETGTTRNPWFEFANTLLFQDPQTVTPTTAALTTSTFAPTVTASNNQRVTPSTAALTLTAFAPTVTVSNNVRVVPDAASLSLSTFAPTVTASQHVLVTPSTASLALTGFAPTIRAWSPLDLSGLVALFGQDMEGLVPGMEDVPWALQTAGSDPPDPPTSPGDPISSLTNWAGLPDFTVLSGMSAPTYQPSPYGGFGSVNFDGSDDALGSNSSSYNSTGRYTVCLFVLGRDNNGDRIFSAITTSFQNDYDTPDAFTIGQGYGSNFWRIEHNVFAANGGDLYVTSSEQNAGVLFMEIDSDAGTESLLVPGKASNSSTLTTHANINANQLQLGAGRDGNAVSFFGQCVILGGFATTTALTAEQKAAAIAYYQRVFAARYTPSTASFTLTSFAPTVAVSNNVRVVPTTASLSLATFAPSVAISDHKRVVPGTASLTLSTFAPTVSTSDHKVVTPTTAALSLSTFAPSVTLGNNQEVVPGKASLVLTTFAPTVTASDHQEVTPSTASLVLTSFAPSVVTPRRVEPGAAALSITTFAPIVTASDHKIVTPTVASLSLTTFAPDVSTSMGPSQLTPFFFARNIINRR